MAADIRSPDAHSVAGRKPELRILSLISDVRSADLRLCKDAAVVRDIASAFVAASATGAAVSTVPVAGGELRYLRTPHAGPSRTIFRMKRGETVIVKGNARRAIDCVLRLRPGRNFHVVRSAGNSVVERVR